MKRRAGSSRRLRRVGAGGESTASRRAAGALTEPRTGTPGAARAAGAGRRGRPRSEEHTSELQSRSDLVCRLLLEKKKNKETLKSGGERDRLQQAGALAAQVQ